MQTRSLLVVMACLPFLRLAVGLGHPPAALQRRAPALAWRGRRTGIGMAENDPPKVRRNLMREQLLLEERASRRLFVGGIPYGMTEAERKAAAEHEVAKSRM